jgi:protein DGCR14
MVNGFKLMGTPSPAPGVEESPLMTWGEIDGTPLRLDASELNPSLTPGPVFKVSELLKYIYIFIFFNHGCSCECSNSA